MKSKASKIFGAIYFASIISCVLLSAYLVADVWGRYFSKAEGGDSARVAKFKVEAAFINGENTDGEGISFDLSEGVGTDTAEYRFSVTGNSEVAFSYDVVLTVPEGLPDSVNFTVVDQDGVTTTPFITGAVYTFANVGRIETVGETKEYTLKITAMDFEQGAEYTDIQIKVVALQVD